MPHTLSFFDRDQAFHTTTRRNPRREVQDTTNDTTTMPFAAGRAPQHQQLKSNGADGNGENEHHRTPDDNSAAHSRDQTAELPPSKKLRLGSNAQKKHKADSRTAVKRKVVTKMKHCCRYPVRDQRGLLLLSFPLKLHLILQRCEADKVDRRNNCKRTKRGHGCRCEVRDRDESDNLASSRLCSKRTQNTEKDSNDSIIGWLSSGTAFKIYDEERFVREVMPSYFFERNDDKPSFDTFKRNLDMWGFSRVPFIEGPSTRNVYVCSHPYFLKGRPSACRNMKFRVEP